MSLAVLNSDFSTIMANATNFPDTTYFIVNDPAVPLDAAKIASSDEEVVRMINYNHIPGRVLHSPQFTNGSRFATAAGVDVTITVGDDEKIWVNDARVTRMDVLVSNGVVHVVDKVGSLILRNRNSNNDHCLHWLTCRS